MQNNFFPFSRFRKFNVKIPKTEKYEKMIETKQKRKEDKQKKTNKYARRKSWEGITRPPSQFESNSLFTQLGRVILPPSQFESVYPCVYPYHQHHNLNPQPLLLKHPDIP